MTKKKKRIVSALLSTAILSMGITGAVASAFVDGDFYFNLGSCGTGWSSSQGFSKVESVNVLPTAGRVKDHPMNLSVYNGSHTKALSGSVCFNSTDERDIYYNEYPRVGEKVCLKGSCGYSGSYLKGIWKS